MYPEVSNFSGSVDRDFVIIFCVAIFFLIGITAVMLIFVRKYRRSKHPKAEQFRERTWIEITWTVIPIIIVLFLFYFGYDAYSPMENPPSDALVVKTYGKMWEWSFEYENGKTSKELVVPVNKAVRCNLISLDVIHGFFIPAFRIKEDVVPGKDNFVWFIPKEEGQYEILCSAYCGLKHSFMESKVVVVTEDRFKNWLDSLPAKEENEPEGLTLIKQNACTGCHSLDGSKGTGPTLYGVFDTTITVIEDEKEKEVIVDEIYIRRSLFDPDAEVVKGFQSGLMKSYKGVIKNDDVKKITEYLKTLKK
jgi:cytochrome c oxidase subunit II